EVAAAGMQAGRGEQEDRGIGVDYWSDIGRAVGEFPVWIHVPLSGEEYARYPRPPVPGGPARGREQSVTSFSQEEGIARTMGDVRDATVALDVNQAVVAGVDLLPVRNDRRRLHEPGSRAGGVA